MGSKSRVLVVDDDPHVRAALCEELGVHFDVQSADSGEAALRLLEKDVVDALVSDVEHVVGGEREVEHEGHAKNTQVSARRGVSRLDLVDDPEELLVDELSRQPRRRGE